MSSVYPSFVKENINSDQSISEDEDSYVDWSENCISLGNNVETKGNLQVLPKVDLLRDAHEFNSAIITSPKVSIVTCHEDEIEFPAFDNVNDSVHMEVTSPCISNKEIICFPKEASFGTSDEEIISDDDDDKGGTYIEASREYEAPIEELNYDPHKHWNKSMADLLDNYSERVEQSENPEIPVNAIVQHGNIEHSMSDFLDCFQEKSGLPQPNIKMISRTKRRSKSLVIQRSKSSLGDRNIDNNYATEALDSEESSENEEEPQNLKSIVPGKTMADQFQEVLGYAPQIAIPRQLGTGLFGKLQSVMQNEKETEMLFLRRLHLDDSSNGENRYINVKILSRSLEAKLTVCSCALVKDNGNNTEVGMMFKGSLTIVFSSKTCSDVELEVGNFIRVHPPWKEAKVEGNVIILSTYFTQI